MPWKLYNPRLKERARELRRNLTPAEKLLWQHLRDRSFQEVRFYRQRPLGPYIVDFCCFRPRKLVIEIDGESHYTPEGRLKDIQRESFLKDMGFKILRFTNREVLENVEGVLFHISKTLFPSMP